MEAELSVLKEPQTDLVRIYKSGTVHQFYDLYKIPRQTQSNNELRRRLSAVDCQLRKEQKAVRRYEVATEKLLQFVEVIIYYYNNETLFATVS